MLDVAPTELLAVALVALIVIGPKDLPKAMRVVGQWVGRARTMARHFRTGIDTMIREAELEEMEKSWAAENERIMREHPLEAPAEMEPAPPPASAAPAVVTPAVVTPAADAPAPTLFGPEDIPAADKPKRTPKKKAAP